MKKNYLSKKNPAKIKSSAIKGLFIASVLLSGSGLAVAQSWVPVGGADFTTGSSQYNSLAIDHIGNLYMAYEDSPVGTGGTGKATVMKYNGYTWSVLGSEGFSAGNVNYTSIALNSTGTPYVAYVDNATTVNRATVRTFNGTSWVNVGVEGFSVGEVNNTGLAIDTAGNPYVVFEDFTCFQKASVMKFNGTNWGYLGSSCFTPDMALYITLAVWNETPFVLYCDAAYGNKASVMMYNGTNWVNVGAPGFSAGFITYNSLAISAAGTPYVAFGDNGYNGRARVMKFDGTNWVNVGSPGFSDSTIDYLSLALDASGTPYLAFQDMGTLKATVMNFNGTSWVNTGTPNFTAGTAQWISMAINQIGKPYVAYQDYPNSQKATVATLNGTWLNEPLTTTSTSGSINVFPNPGKGYINLKINTAINLDASVTIINTLGEKVKEYKIPTNKETQLQLNAPPGVYFITAVTNNESVSAKLVVE